MNRNGQDRERLEEINAQITQAREKAQDLWAKFEAARRPLHVAGAQFDSQALEALDALNEDYHAAATKLATLEKGRDLVFSEITDRDGGGSSTAGATPGVGKPGGWLASAIAGVKAQHPHLAAMGGGR